MAFPLGAVGLSPQLDSVLEDLIQLLQVHHGELIQLALYERVGEAILLLEEVDRELADAYERERELELLEG